MMKIIYTKTYNTAAAKFLKKYPHLKKQYQKTLELLEINPSHPSLRLHKLKGKFQKLYSASINISYRIIIDFVIKKDTIIPIRVGPHDDAYQ